MFDAFGNSIFRKLNWVKKTSYCLGIHGSQSDNCIPRRYWLDSGNRNVTLRFVSNEDWNTGIGVNIRTQCGLPINATINADPKKIGLSWSDRSEIIPYLDCCDLR